MRTRGPIIEHTGASYAGKARTYAAHVDSQPWNAHYERPAVRSLLPPLAGLNVLDVGCGSGWYAEQLLQAGARVTAIDFDAEFVALTKGRTAGRVAVRQHDLAQPLSFAASGEFDLVVAPLVLHYLRDWEPVFREFHRVLQPEGVLVFSTHHPINDWLQFRREDYFAVEILDDHWDWLGDVRFYRRPLTVISRDLCAAGFVMERLLEPRPTEAFRAQLPEAYEKLCRAPWFLVIRAVKSRGG